MTNVAVKAMDLLQKGLVRVTNVTYNSLSSIIKTLDDDGNWKDHHLAIWRDGRFSCECEWFLKSKSVRLDLWADNLLIKAECKHALATKLTEHYERWIRMVKEHSPDGGFLLRSVEDREIIHVKSLEEEIDAGKLVKKNVTVSKPLPPRKGIIEKLD